MTNDTNPEETVESTPEEQELIARAKALTDRVVEMLTQDKAPNAVALQVVLNLAGAIAGQSADPEWHVHCIACLRGTADDIQQQTGVTFN